MGTVVDGDFSGERLGLRERQKKERRTRIIAAAREIFRDRGFDEATTAEIAKRAGVGAGTLFRYVRDKHELLLLVLHDELEQATSSGISAMRASRSPLVARLLELYRPRFAFWAADLALARFASAPPQGGNAGDERPQFARIGRFEEQIVSNIADVVAEHARDNRLAPRTDVVQIARAIHHLYIGALRAWMNEADPQLDAAMTILRAHFTLMVEGIFAT